MRLLQGKARVVWESKSPSAMASAVRSVFERGTLLSAALKPQRWATLGSTTFLLISLQIPLPGRRGPLAQTVASRRHGLPS